jgi:hypothetical protein
LEVAEQQLPETLDPKSLHKYFTLTGAELQKAAFAAVRFCRAALYPALALPRFICQFCYWPA